MRLETWLERCAAETPEGVALEVGAESLRWTELHARARKCAARLAGCGVGPGATLALLLASAAYLYAVRGSALLLDLAAFAGMICF